MVFTGLTEESLDVNGYLEWNATYFWYVEGTPSGGGDVVSTYPWSFTTSDYVCQGGPVTGDINGDCKVDFTDLAMVANNWFTEVPKVIAP